MKINAIDYIRRETHRTKGCTTTSRTDKRCGTCKEFDRLVGWHVTDGDRRLLKSLRIDPA